MTAHAAWPWAANRAEVVDLVPLLAAVERHRPAVDLTRHLRLLEELEVLLAGDARDLRLLELVVQRLGITWLGRHDEDVDAALVRCLLLRAGGVGLVLLDRLHKGHGDETWQGLGMQRKL